MAQARLKNIYVTELNEPHQPLAKISVRTMQAGVCGAPPSSRLKFAQLNPCKALAYLWGGGDIVTCSLLCAEDALIHWEYFLYITTFLVEVALIHEIGTISPLKTPVIKNLGAYC